MLLDFVMPRMNGYQFCRAVRSQERFRTLPVVLMSAKSDKIREKFVQQTGAIDAITKPFDAQALVAVIENALKRVELGSAPIAAADSFEDDEPPWFRAPSEDFGERGAVVLSGDMAALPIGAILQMLHVERQSGVLAVTRDKPLQDAAASEVGITWRQGYVDLVQSRGAGDEFRLGRYFIEEGLVTPAEIDELLKRQSDSEPTARASVPDASSPRRLLGDGLVDAGRISEEQLRTALTRQASELIYELLRWQRGRFEFRRIGASPLAERAKLSLPVASVVMEGFRRVDEWRVVEERLGSFEAVLQRDPMAIATLVVGELPRAEKSVLDAIDGERTVREVIGASHMSSFDACRVLCQLLEARLVRSKVA